MKVVAIHTISDPEAFFGGQLDLPDGTSLPTVAPSEDGTKAVCVWEADSVDSIRNFVDPATEGIATNEYFQANEQYSMGLPTHAGAAS